MFRMKKLYMKKLGLVMLMVGLGFSQIWSAESSTSVDPETGVVTYIYDVGNNISVANKQILVIHGNLLTYANIFVNNGGALVVYGDLISYGDKIESNGKIIVQGDLISTSPTAIIENNGDLVVGGDVNVESLTTSGNNLLKIFFLNPDAKIDGVPASLYGDYDDIPADLKNTEIGGVNIGSIIDIVIVPIAIGYQWKTDVLSSDWRLAPNWTGNLVPTSSTSARIKNPEAGFVNPQINAGEVIVVQNLTIEAGATLTLKPGAQLTVNGKLTVAIGVSPDDPSGSLIMEHEYGEGGMSSLITNGEVSGNVRTKMVLHQDQWFYLGSSRKDAVFSDFSAGADGVIINVYRTNKWWGIKSGLASRALRPLEGMVTNYLPDTPDKDGDGLADVRIIEYEGEIHTSDVSRLFDEQGFHLLANPFPAFVDWQSSDGWARVDVDPTIWYRAKIGEEMTFVTYNNDASVPTMARIALSPYELMDITEDVILEHSLLAPMQAVWIKTLKSGVTTTIGPSSRKHGMEISRLKSSSSVDDNVIRIEAENSFSRDGAVIFFADGFTEGYDRGDAEKYFNDSENIPEVFTRIENQSLAINGLPALTGNVHSIPLSVRNRVEGDVSLKFDLRYFSGEYSVYFEDKVTGTLLNVGRENTYDYSVNQTGEDHNRFVLHFYKVTTALEEAIVDNDEIAAGDEISIKSIAGKVLISVGIDLVQQNPGIIEIYTIDGRKISDVPARSSRTLVLLPNERGVYVIRAKFGQLVKTDRVVNSIK